MKCNALYRKPEVQYNVNEAISEFPCASVSKRVYVRNLSYENEFDWHENETIGGTRFHINGFALRLVLKQRFTRTRKCPIVISSSGRKYMCRLLRNVHYYKRRPSCCKERVHWNLRLRVRSFGVIWIKISDSRSLTSWCIKGTDESPLVTDSLATLMRRDPSDLGSLIPTRIQIQLKRRTLWGGYSLTTGVCMKLLQSLEFHDKIKFTRTYSVLSLTFPSK